MFFLTQRTQDTSAAVSKLSALQRTKTRDGVRPGTEASGTLCTDGSRRRAKREGGRVQQSRLSAGTSKLVLSLPSPACEAPLTLYGVTDVLPATSGSLMCLHFCLRTTFPPPGDNPPSGGGQSGDPRGQILHPLQEVLRANGHLGDPGPPEPSILTSTASPGSARGNLSRWTPRGLPNHT